MSPCRLIRVYEAAIAYNLKLISPLKGIRAAETPPEGVINLFYFVMLPTSVTEKYIQSWLEA